MVQAAKKKETIDRVVYYADMFSAMGAEARLRIMQLLLSAHPDGMVVGEIGSELNIPSSTLSHHLEKLKNEDWSPYAARGLFSGTREYRNPERIAWVSLRGVLHPQ